MMRIRKRRENRRRELAEAIRRRIKFEAKLVEDDRPKISKDKLENNLTLNLDVFFDEKADDYPKCLAEMRQAIAAIPTTDLPKGLRPPIKSGKQREKRSWHCVSILLANIHDMMSKKKTSLAVSLSPNTYAHTKAGAGFINLVKLLHHYDLLGMSIGFQNPTDPKKSRWTRIWPLDKLTDLMNLKLDADKILKCEPEHLVELRDTEIKRVDKYRTKKIKRPVPRKELWKRLGLDKYKEVLDRDFDCYYFNSVYSDYKITCRKNGRTIHLKPALCCRYGSNLDSGGRFYMVGRNNYQSLSKEERETVRMISKDEYKTTHSEGYPTKEYDFGGLHIRILYALAGESYPKEKDPYKEVLIAMGKDPDEICERFPSIRDDLKEMLLALVNGEIENPEMKEETTLRRANYRLFNYWKKKKDPVKKMETKYECDKRKAVWQKAGILNPKRGAKDVLRAFYKAHKPIKHYFNNGCTHNLMNIDQQITYYVLRDMMPVERPIPTLPVHDSFCTFREYKYRKMLKRAMRECYQFILRKITNRPKASFLIPIKPVIVKNQL